MAIDTRDKRASAVGVTLPWRGLLPLPDGAWSTGDRQMAALYYSGISSAVSEETALTLTTFALHRESMSGSGDGVMRVGRHDSVERAGGKA